MNTRLPLLTLICFAALSQQVPRALPDGYALPNGWRITPIGRAIPTEDMVLNVLPAPDGRAVMALHSGFNPHGLVVIDAHTDEATQRIPLRSAWLGMTWHPDGKRLFVSGGNAEGKTAVFRAPIYVFGYENGKLSKDPVSTLEETIGGAEVNPLWVQKRPTIDADQYDPAKHEKLYGGAPGARVIA